MSIPKFTAENSLYQTSGHYRRATSGATAIAASIIPSAGACTCKKENSNCVLRCIGGPPAPGTKCVKLLDGSCCLSKDNYAFIPYISILTNPNNAPWEQLPPPDDQVCDQA
jgi:hypothetical protein